MDVILLTYMYMVDISRQIRKLSLSKLSTVSKTQHSKPTLKIPPSLIQSITISSQIYVKSGQLAGQRKCHPRKDSTSPRTLGRSTEEISCQPELCSIRGHDIENIALHWIVPLCMQGTILPKGFTSKMIRCSRNWSHSRNARDAFEMCIRPPILR